MALEVIKEKVVVFHGDGLIILQKYPKKRLINIFLAGSGTCYVFDALCDFEDRLLGYVKPNICVNSNEVEACRANFDSMVVADCVFVSLLLLSVKLVFQ